MTPPGRADRLTILAARAATALGAALLAILFWQHLGHGAFLDHIEASVLLPAWNYAHGAPLFEMEAGLPRFAMVYGPLAYLPHAALFVLFGPGLVASKLLSMLALAGSVAALSWHFHRRPDGTPDFAVLLLVAVCLYFSPESFWMRADPLEFALVAASVIAMDRPRAWIWLGVCIGLAVNLKAHAFLYFAPQALALLRRDGPAPVCAAAILSVLVFLLPFALPGVSLPDYIASVQAQVNRRALNLGDTPGVALTGLLLLAPLLATLLTAQSPIPLPRRIPAYACIATLAVLTYPALFPGAGPYHFFPLVPVIADAYRRLRPEFPTARLFPLIILAAGILTMQRDAHLIPLARSWADTARQAVDIARRHPGETVQIGLGDSLVNYHVTQVARVALAFAGTKPVLDAQAMAEFERSGLEASTRSLPYIEGCRIRLWLIPAGEAPFALPSYYDHRPVFSAAFREGFARNYRKVGTEGAFDVWGCGVGG